MMKNENDFVAAISTKLSLRTPPGGGVEIDPLNTEIKNRRGSRKNFYFPPERFSGFSGRRCGFTEAMRAASAVRRAMVELGKLGSVRQHGAGLLESEPALIKDCFNF